MTAALDDTGAERPTPPRLQAPITPDFVPQYHRFVEHAADSGTNTAENLRALITLVNDDPELRERMHALSQTQQKLRAQRANAARADGVRRAWRTASS